MIELLTPLSVSLVVGAVLIGAYDMELILT